MVDINRVDEQRTAVGFADRTPAIPNLRGIDDWMERDRLTHSAPSESSDTSSGPLTQLLLDSEVAELQARWNTIQADFVDEPRRSVKEADKLVATAVQRVAEGLRGNELRSKSNGTTATTLPPKISESHFSAIALSSPDC